MIVDEAHTAVTGLSREMQRRLNPTTIIEYKATPSSGSNLLHSVTAQEIKGEEMIKLQIVLAEHATWRQAVDGALARQAELEAIARKDKDYIRPIVLRGPNITSVRIGCVDPYPSSCSSFVSRSGSSITRLISCREPVGRRTVKTLPRLSWLCTSMLPPSISVRCLLMVNPRPAP